MEKFFAVDGPFMTFLTKFGQLVILSLVWALCSLPVVTIVGAGSSFYYAVAKSIRHDVGYPVREFFRNFKRAFKCSLVFNIILIAAGVLIWFNTGVVLTGQWDELKPLYLIYIVVSVIAFAWVIYLMAVISRFDVGKVRMAKMALKMIFLQPVRSLLLAAVPVGLAWVAFFYLPIPCSVFLPGLWVYASTYLVEPALKRYMPKFEGPEEEKEWFDE